VRVRNRTSCDDVTDKVPNSNASFETFSGSISVEDIITASVTLNPHLTHSTDISMCPFLEVEI
jgi:hypothetical protein